jgi:23S rRNA-/tRNA-specific pseudouridylate synthase
VAKTYLVRVHGHPVADQFHCDAPIGRQALAAGTREVDAAAGDAALTQFTVLQRSADGTCLLEARPLTGRTNQIRIHCACLGFPVVGDAAYHGGEAGPRQTLDVSEPALCLHAWKIDFAHPVSAEAMSFTAAPPDWGAGA